jgi:S1-C subfamily serine protease
MKTRVLLIAALLAGGFYYLTSVAEWRPLRLFRPESAAANNPIWKGPDVAQSAGLSSDELNNIDIYKRAHSATVNITSTVYRQGWFMQIYPSQNSGSGFFVDDKGKILTNWHVVQGNGELVVTLANKKKYKATLLERDPGNDLALISIEPREKVAALRMGDSDGVQVGQKVLAIGNPFGLEGTLTTGIVSSLGRTIQDEGGRELEDLMQTDAAINPGNSGGPLLDSQGNVVGINTAIYGPGGNIGIGFAMPINKAKVMLDDFQAGRRYSPPRLGVNVIFVAGGFAEALGLPEEGGLLVQGIQRGSAAERAGLRGPRGVEIIGGYEIGVGGDLILSVDGRPCDRSDAISRALSRRRAGDTIELRILRAGRTMTLKVTLGGAAAGERL